MAKFTATVPLNLRLPGGFEAIGTAGTTHRIPDALVEEFIRDQVPGIPGGVTWITQDETSGIAGFDPSTKYDKAGGTISGAVTVTGALIVQAAVTASGALIAQTSISTPSLTATNARFKGIPWYDVVAYGAVFDGSTNDRAAIQAAIDAAVAGGGQIFMPPGSTKIQGGSLDFSAMKGGLKGVRFMGSGAGDLNTGNGAATVILNDQTVPAIKAYGTLAGATVSSIAALELSGFMVKNLQNLGSNYTIDFDYVIGMFRLSDLYVWGQNFTGNGIQIRNFGHGQGTLERVQVREFRTGTGIRLAVETTPNVDVAPNSGNIALIACAVMDALKGYHVTGTNLINSGSMVACKAVNVSDVTSSVGFHFGTNAMSWALTSPHAERFSTGYWLENAEYCSLVSPFASFPTGTPDANSAGVRIAGTATGCSVTGALLLLTHYGVSFEDTARTNVAMGSDRTAARVLTSWSRDISTNASNHVLKTEGETPFLWTMGATKAAMAKLGITGVISPTSLTATQQNWNPTGLATAGVIRVAATTAVAIGGISAGAAGDRIIICNISAFTITLNHGDAGSSAANQILITGGANLALAVSASVELWYDGTSSRWRVVSK